LWALYEWWRGRHAVARDLGDNACRFDVFCHNVRLIHEFNRMFRGKKKKDAAGT
jgi:KDEL-tailed cysteine endopeptidase